MDSGKIIAYILVGLFLAFIFGYDIAKKRIIKKMYAKRIDYMTDRTIDKLYLINCYLPSQHQITTKEKESFDFILNKAIEYWKRAFENENLNNTYKVASQDVKAYFYLRVFEYLEDIRFDYIFEGNEVSKYVSEESTLYTCSLTDFGKVMYKILLSTASFGEEHSYIRNGTSKDIQDSLESGIIQYFRYRP